MERPATRVAVCVFIAILVGSSVAIKGGTLANRCDYNGLVVVQSNVMIVCTGVLTESLMLYLPGTCRALISGLVAAGRSVVVNAEERIYQIGITWNDLATIQNGVVMFDLTTALSVVGNRNAFPCFKSGILYDGADLLIENSCVVIGYGADTDTSAGDYDPAKLNSASIVKSTGFSCCKSVFDTLSPAEKGGITVPATDPYNCVTSTGATCGLGDIGAPVMCNTSGGRRVIIGLTASTPCIDNSVFLIHDVTGSAVKFGI